MRKKLTTSLKNKIKNKEVRESDLAGEALTYFKRVRALDKARRVKADKYIVVGEYTIKKDTEYYRELREFSEDEGLTVKQYIRKHKKAIREFLASQLNYVFDDLDDIKEIIKETPRKHKFLLNKKKIRRDDLLLNIDLLNQKLFSITDAFKIRAYVGMSPTGSKLDLRIPTEEEYTDIEDEEEFENLLGQYKAIVIRSRQKYISKQNNRDAVLTRGGKHKGA